MIGQPDVVIHDDPPPEHEGPIVTEDRIRVAEYGGVTDIETEGPLDVPDVDDPDAEGPPDVEAAG